jgi:hypothetical protein
MLCHQNLQSLFPLLGVVVRTEADNFILESPDILLAQALSCLKDNKERGLYFSALESYVQKSFALRENDWRDTIENIRSKTIKDNYDIKTDFYTKDKSKILEIYYLDPEGDDRNQPTTTTSAEPVNNIKIDNDDDDDRPKIDKDRSKPPSLLENQEKIK